MSAAGGGGGGGGRCGIDACTGAAVREHKLVLDELDGGMVDEASHG